MNRLRALVCSVAVLLSFTALTVPVFAADPFNSIDCNKAKGSAICADRNQTTNPLTGKDGLLTKAANILAVLGSIIAVIMIVYAGFTYVTSGGESQKINDAKNTIIYASVGLVIIAFGRGIVIFILNRL